VVGSFSGGVQWWAAPLKIAAGLSLSAILCLPSLYVFSCLTGQEIRIRDLSSVVAGMLASGALSRSDFLGRRDHVLADGSRISAETFRIRSLRIGGRVVEDVVATAGALSSPFLLGQSFLRRLKSWSIDNANDTLVLE
jgi:hypothetical protein